MIRDEERREVAARLREPKESLLAYADDELIRLREETGCQRGADLYERLADLIDRPTTTRHGRFKKRHGWEIPLCEVCSYSIGDARWNYCPKCGATIEEAAK